MTGKQQIFARSQPGSLKQCFGGNQPVLLCSSKKHSVVKIYISNFNKK